MPYKATLNTDIVAALHAVQQQLAAAPARYAFLADTLPGLQAAVAELQLDDAELITAADEERLDALVDQIDTFAALLRDGHRLFAGSHTAELPDWLNRFQKKQAGYYAGLVAGFAGAGRGVRFVWLSRANKTPLARGLFFRGAANRI